VRLDLVFFFFANKEVLLDSGGDFGNDEKLNFFLEILCRYSKLNETLINFGKTLKFGIQ
jgi:hypothetical protein